VELTAGGGGKSEQRLSKVKERNKELDGQRVSLAIVEPCIECLIGGRICRRNAMKKKQRLAKVMSRFQCYQSVPSGSQPHLASSKTLPASAHGLWVTKRMVPHIVAVGSIRERERKDARRVKSGEPV
jgi:hypothetical protein